MQRSLAAQLGNTQISDITLTGIAHRIAGSDDESGTVTLRGLSNGTTRLDFNFPSGPRSEFRSVGADNPVGAWSGPDGVAHPIASHNLMNDWGWFRLFTFASSANAQTYSVTLVEQAVKFKTAIWDFDRRVAAGKTSTETLRIERAQLLKQREDFRQAKMEQFPYVMDPEVEDHRKFAAIANMIFYDPQPAKVFPGVGHSLLKMQGSTILGYADGYLDFIVAWAQDNVRRK